jgi:hypothetical protein
MNIIFRQLILFEDENLKIQCIKPIKNRLYYKKNDNEVI